MKKIIGIVVILLVFGVILFPHGVLGAGTNNEGSTELSLEQGVKYTLVGDLVTVPVKLAKVPNDGLLSVNAKISFDASILQYASCTAGSIVKSSSSTFSAACGGNTISMQFADDASKNNIIKEDGIFANLKFRVIKDIATESAITVNELTINNINNIKVASIYTNGSVTRSVIIAPSSVVFDMNNPADVSITIKDGEVLSDIKAGTASLVKGSDYTVIGNTVKISKGYYRYIFTKWPDGVSNLTFVMASGKTAELKATSILGAKLITPDAIEFDMNNPSDVSITIKDGEALSDIKAGTASLAKGSDYMVTGNIVKISKGYYQYIFTKWPSGVSNLTFVMVSGKTAELKATSILGAKLITPDAIEFDMNNPSDVSITIKDGEALSDIKAGTASLAKGSDYTVTGNIVKISKYYYQYIFGKWPDCICNLTFIMTSGKTAALKTTKKASQEPFITPSEVQFDMNSTSGVSITIKNGETLSDIKSGTASLTKGIDYTVSGNVVTINGYFRYIFGKWPDVTCNLTFIMTSGKTAVLKAAKKPVQQPLITPAEVQFDMNSTSGVSIAIKNGETLSDIKSGTASLTKGIDYTVAGNVVTINGYFRYIFGKWPDVICNLTFIMTSGKTAVLKAAKKPVQQLLITPAEVQFDMSSTSGVKITIKNGETLADIKSGTSSLAKGTDYIVSGNTVTIDGYFRYIFGKWPNVKCNLTLVMISGNTAVLQAAKKFVVNNGIITPGAIIFDINKPADIIINVKNGETLSSIKAGEIVLEKGVDYTVTGSTIKISKDYLLYKFYKRCDIYTNLTFIMMSGNTDMAEIASTILAASPPEILPNSETFNKKEPSFIYVNMLLGGYKLSSINNGASTLTLGTDYILNNSLNSTYVLLNKSYLAQLAVGRYTMTFNLSGEKQVALSYSFTVEDKIYPSITPKEIVFDKNTPENKTVELSIGNGALVSISSNSYLLQANKDYVLSKNKVILKSSYLANLDVNTVLDFKYSEGKNSKLSVVIIEKTHDKNLRAIIGSSSTERGAVIMIPVTLIRLPQKGLSAMNFTLQFDPKYIEYMTYEAGYSCTLPEKNLEVACKDNKITVQFIDDTLYDNPIKNDGQLIFFRLKVKDGVAGQTRITVSDMGIAADSDFNKYNAIWTEGTITVGE